MLLRVWVLLLLLLMRIAHHVHVHTRTHAHYRLLTFLYEHEFSPFARACKTSIMSRFFYRYGGCLVVDLVRVSNQIVVSCYVRMTNPALIATPQEESSSYFKHNAHAREFLIRNYLFSQLQAFPVVALILA